MSQPIAPTLPAPAHAAVVRSVGMRLGDLFRDPQDGMASVVKTAAMIAVIGLTAAFAVQAWTRVLDWMDYVGYALSITIASGAPIASSAISIAGPRLAGITGKYGANAPQPDPAAPSATFSASVEVGPAAAQPPKS